MAKPALNQFNGGVISPWLEGRIDLPKYNYSLAESLNFIPLVEGSIKRRGGSHYVAPLKEVEAVCFKIVVKPDEAKYDALVCINNELCDKIYCAPGEKITWSVSADGYLPQSGMQIVGEEDMTLTVTLVSVLYRSTLTVNTVPDDALVYINGQFGNKRIVTTGSTAIYRVEKEGYAVVEGSVEVPDDLTITVVLGIRFEIKAIPADAKVVINGVERDYIDVQPGDVVNWKVSKQGYASKSGTETIESSMVLYVNLEEGNNLNDVIFEKSAPGQYVIYLEQAGYYDVMLCSPGGGAGGAATAYGLLGNAGGSGAAYAGKIYLNAGKCIILLGENGKGGNSYKREGDTGRPAFSLQEYVSTYTYLNQPGGAYIFMTGGDGGEGAMVSGSQSSGGGGKIKYFEDVIEAKRYIKSDGKAHSGVSVLGNGFGAGGVPALEKGGDGSNAYCKIVWLGKA